MSNILELASLIALAGFSGFSVRAISRRRSARRNIIATEKGLASFPCRVTWREGIGKKGSTYGKIIFGSESEPLFVRKMGPAVPIPYSKRIRRESSWRNGLAILKYTVPGRGEISILLSETEAGYLQKILGK